MPDTRHSAAVRQLPLDDDWAAALDEAGRPNELALGHRRERVLDDEHAVTVRGVYSILLAQQLDRGRKSARRRLNMRRELEDAIGAGQIAEGIRELAGQVLQA